MGANPPGWIEIIFWKKISTYDITCFNFGDDRLRGLASAEGQILPLPIDFDGRPYNTLTLPCDNLRANCEVHKFVYDTTLTELIPSLHALAP